jgi:threonine synthase
MKLDHVLGLKCTICGVEYGVDEAEYVCPKHGTTASWTSSTTTSRSAGASMPNSLADHPDPFHLALPAPVARRPWRTAALDPGNVLSSVGWTPLYPAPRLAAGLGLGNTCGSRTTGGSRRRLSRIGHRPSPSCKARELGYEVVTTASTGNAAAALAGLCAAVAQANVIFVPRTAPQAKIAQLLVYGSRVLLVDGTYDDAFELCLRAAPEFGWYSRNTGYNPYMSEGKKTVSYEICEQLGNSAREAAERGAAAWSVPDVVVVPVGDGCIIGGVHKGFQDLLALGWIERDAAPHRRAGGRLVAPGGCLGTWTGGLGNGAGRGPLRWPTASSPACPATASRPCAPCGTTAVRIFARVR